MNFEYKNRNSIAYYCMSYSWEFHTKMWSTLDRRGCPTCRYEKVAIKNGKIKDQFVQQANQIHKTSMIIQTLSM